MRVWVKFIICFAAVALISGVMMDAVHLSEQHQCSCCKSKCPNENNCHGDQNDCLCSGKAPMQFTLVQIGRLPEPSLFISLSQRTNLLYSFRFLKDIFHPPKA